MNDIASQIADNVAAAVKATNAIPADGRALTFHYNRQSPKRRRLIEPTSADLLGVSSDVSINYPSATIVIAQGTAGEEGKTEVSQCLNFQSDSVEGSASLSKMVAVLCEQHLFLPLLRAFEMFLPSCSLLPFIRALQVGDQTVLLLFHPSPGLQFLIGESIFLLQVLAVPDGSTSLRHSPNGGSCILISLEAGCRFYSLVTNELTNIEG